MRRKISGRSWITREGLVIPVRAMKDSHLLNTVQFLRRHVLHFKLKEVRRMAQYAADAPDGAADAVSLEAGAIGEMPDDDFLKSRVPAFAAMVKEIERRRLT